MQHFDISASLAADLAGARVDPSEAQKALAYLRSKKDGKLFFEYLRAINQNGRAVIRSGQTLGYYRDLLASCERHLRGMPADEMAQTLGWAIRLLRYYRTVPDAAELIQQSQASAPQAESQPAKPATTANPAAAQIPAVGDVFAGLVLERDDSLVVIQVPGFSRERAVANLKVETDTPKWVAGKDRARVEVVGQRQRDTLTILNVKRGPKNEKK